MTEPEPILTRHEDGMITIQHPHEIAPGMTYRISARILDDLVDRMNRAILAEKLRTGDRAQLRDERDRARSTAVALEQENEALLELLAQASTAIDGLLRQWGGDAFLSQEYDFEVEEWREAVDARFTLPTTDDDLAKAFAQAPTLDALLSEEANA